MGVQIWTSGRQQDDLGVGQLAYVGAQRQELGVAVDEQVSRAQQESVVAREVASHLPDPIPVRIRSHACNLNAASFEAHGDKNVEGGETVSGPDLDGGEVDRRDGIPVSFEEGFPSRCRPSFRCWFDSIFLEDVPDRGVGDSMAEIVERSLNSIVAPR